jgi:hypothetical protein
MKKKIKYQGGLTKIICARFGRHGKKEFSKLISIDQLPHVKAREKKWDIDVVSFSGKRDFEEQVLSILSFLRYAGKPKRWVIYSDDSHTKFHHDFISRNFDFASIERWNKNEDKYAPYAATLDSYMKYNVLGKRMYAYANHLSDGQIIFLDSDVVFYSAIFEKLDIVIKDGGSWYLPDAGWGTLDSRYKASHVPEMFQLNGGCFISSPAFSWELAYAYLQSLNNTFEYFSDQTAFHIAFIGQGAKPLDPRVCVLNCDDQFDFSYKYGPEEIALRHYVNPIRHKMWQKNWKWHLNY